jgi:cyclomaltodextrin glucanotransferase
MRTRWIDADAWVFTRPYLGSSVAVALNRADEPRTLDVEHLELEDGRHADVLGGAPLDVSGGRARVVLAPRSIAVYEQTRPLPTGRAVVDLQLHGVHTEFGERVAVCGDAPELGAWDLERAVPMEWIDDATWGTTVALDASAGRDVHYKYVLRRHDGWQREPRRGHRRRVPQAGATVWRDEWHG